MQLAYIMLNKIMCVQHRIQTSASAKSDLIEDSRDSLILLLIGQLCVLLPAGICLEA